MPFIKTTTPDAATGAVRDMYEHQQAAWGYVPNYAKVFCHRPEVLARWGRLLAEIKRPMDKRRFELVTFIAAYELRNTACALAHGKALLEFFDDREICAIVDRKYEGVVSEAEAAMLEYARQVAKDASRVTSGQIGALSELGFGDDEIFDIAATAAGRSFFTKLLDALGVEADRPLRSVDVPLRRALTVGRPIDHQPPVSMPGVGDAPPGSGTRSQGPDREAPIRAASG